jgi:hypothetical protein
MERIDAVEIDHSPATALIGDDFARVDVIVAFGVAEAAIGARLAHSRQPHGWRAGAVRARRQWFVRWVLLDHGLSLLTPPARSAAAFEQAIEFQLEHVEQSVAAIYNRDGRLRERTKMMQHWAHKIDELRDEKAKPKRRLKVVA